MGILCQINLFKPCDEVYHPGQDVAGVIKYSVDVPTKVYKIITSLKGIGYIVLKEDYGSKWESTYETTEEFVDVDTIVQAEKTEIAVGSYELKFHYILPPNKLPSTMKFRKCFRDYKAKCFIKYYVRIKFERPGLFTFNTHFRKEINVVSKVEATLPREPTIYTENKKLMRLFSSNDSLNIKATILNSVVPVGGTIEVHYDIKNNSHVIVKSIKTKLVQVYMFKAKGHRKVTYEKDVEDTEVKTLPINCQETQNRVISIHIPIHLCTLGNAMIVSRNYVVRIIAHLPIPHRNGVLDIPVQIGADENVAVNRTELLQELLSESASNVNYEDPPPPYWEVMGEANKELGDSSDDEADTKNLLKSESTSRGQGSAS